MLKIKYIMHFHMRCILNNQRKRLEHRYQSVMKITLQLKGNDKKVFRYEQ